MSLSNGYMLPIFAGKCLVRSRPGVLRTDGFFGGDSAQSADKILEVFDIDVLFFHFFNNIANLRACNTG